MSETIGHTLRELWGKKVVLPVFRPSCWYVEELDWLIYLERDCSYVATPTNNPHLELLRHGRQTVGIKVIDFLQLSRDARSDLLEWTEVDPDDIRGIEAIWLHNFKLMAPQFELSATSFFKELRLFEERQRMHARWQGNAFYDPYSSGVKRHQKLMQHLQGLDSNRLP